MKLNRSLVLMFATLLLAGCASSGNSATEATADRPTNAGQTVAHIEGTHIEGNFLTGIITEGPYDKGGMPDRWILVEVDPNADCRRRSNWRNNPNCDMMYFKIVDSTRLLRQTGNRTESVSINELRKGQRVRADYTGYDVADSRPSLTAARSVVILEPG